jgi:peptide/nickel transport system permease protein
LQIIPVLLGVSIVVFFMVRAIPGDPAQIMLGQQATQAQVAQLRESMGLDKPIIVQYGLFFKDAIRGDLGDSIVTGRPVTTELLKRLPATFHGRLDPTTGITAITGLVLVDSLLTLNFAGFWDGLLHLIMPALALGTIPMAVVMRMTRSSMLEVMNEDYVRTARAKGVVPWRVVFKHALRNAMLPTITVIGLQVGLLMGGAIITETIFSWPGIGLYAYNSISARDYASIQGVVLYGALLFVLINLVVDILYAVLDPRVRY